MDEEFREAGQKQTKTDQENLKKAQESLKDAFGRKEKGSKMDEDDIVKSARKAGEEFTKDLRAREAGQRVKSERVREDWVEELRGRIGEQKDVIKQKEDELTKTKQDLDRLENSPWHSNLFGKFSGSHYDTVGDKRDEVNRRAEEIRKLKSNLRAHEDELGQTIKG